MKILRKDKYVALVVFGKKRQYCEVKMGSSKNYENSPYELKVIKKRTLKLFHVFAPKCFILKDNDVDIGKFEVKAHKRIFLGYSLRQRLIGYRWLNIRGGQKYECDVCYESYDMIIIYLE